MIEPWFDPIRYAWIPGTLLGVLGGTWGAVLGILAPRGKARTLVLGGLAVLLAASAVCLVAGIAALLSGQPYGVWYGLLLAGVIGVIVLGVNVPVALNVYRQAEARKLQARDLQ
jgi:hypothetical protein